MSGSGSLMGGNWLTNPVGASGINSLQSLQSLNLLRDTQARQATAQAYQASIDPNGNVDLGKFNALIGASPQAAWNAGPAMQQAGEAQGAQASAQNTQTSGHLARLNVMQGYMAPIIQQAEKTGQPVTQAQVVGAINSAAAGGFLSMPDVSRITADLSSQPAGADLLPWVRGHMAANTSASEQLNSATPTPMVQNVGGHLQVVDSNVRTNPGFIGSTATLGLTPGEATQPTEAWVPGPPGAGGIPTWKKVILPRATVTGDPGTGGAAAGAAAGSPYPAGYTGRPAPAQPPGTAATAPLAQPVGGTPAGAPLAAPPIGTPESIVANQQRYQADAGNVALHQSNVVNLQHAYDALQHANTGPGTDRTHEAYAFLQAQGISNIPGLTSDTPDNINNWAIARKALTAYAASQAGAGGSTDLQSQLNQLSNASVDIPNDAARTITRQNIGRERMQMAQVQTAPDPSGAGYIGHTTTFTPSQDQRAYYADMMTPAELRNIQSDPKQWTKFRNSLRIALAHGYFTPDQVPGGPGYTPPPGTPALPAPASSGPQVPTGP